MSHKALKHAIPVRDTWSLVDLGKKEEKSYTSTSPLMPEVLHLHN
jgi:hypothetical protein